MLTFTSTNNKLPTSNDSRLLCGLVACVVAAVSRLVAGCCSGTLSSSNYDVMSHPAIHI